jgi:glycolate oxidase iron-sulfur subunit
MKTQYKIEESIINEEADRCVKCALCAPVCPTYQLTQNESESPRGRIALAQGLVNHQIPLTDITRVHLDHCLSCQACEAVCPAGVQYGSLFNATQALIEAQAPQKEGFVQALPRFLSFNVVRFLLRFYQQSSLQKGLRALRFLGLRNLEQYDAMLPPLEKREVLKSFYPAIGVRRGEVGLFLGCVAKALDQATVLDAIKVLTQVGYAVHLPLTQRCCGALDLHAGRQAAYKSYEQHNQAVFAGLSLKAIISIASGCAVVLSDYPALSAPLREICEFLNTESWNEGISFNPEPQTVILHSPCTLKNILKTSETVQQLLRRIPHINIELVPASVGCCGASGTHFLRYPKEAKAMLFKTLNVFRKKQDVLIVTTNVGCQLHLNQGLTTEKRTLKVIHPVRLLAARMTLKNF